MSFPKFFLCYLFSPSGPIWGKILVPNGLFRLVAASLFPDQLNLCRADFINMHYPGIFPVQRCDSIILMGPEPM